MQAMQVNEPVQAEQCARTDWQDLQVLTSKKWPTTHEVHSTSLLHSKQLFLHGSHTRPFFQKVGKQFVQFPAEMHSWQPAAHDPHDVDPVAPVWKKPTAHWVHLVSLAQLMHLGIEEMQVLHTLLAAVSIQYPSRHLMHLVAVHSEQLSW
jgi:hypothetical protein